MVCEFIKILFKDLKDLAGKYKDNDLFFKVCDVKLLKNVFDDRVRKYFFFFI